MMQLALVVPCYNEREGIVDVIARVPHERLLQLGVTATVYVVDNGSTDGTAAAACRAGATAVHEPRRGKGHALRAGFAAVPAEVDLIAMLDGDMTYDPTELPRMIEPIVSGFADVVLGSRLAGRIHAGSMGAVSRIGNWIFTFLVRSTYRANVSDVLTGYFAFRRTAVDALRPHLHEPGFAIEMEMVTKIARMGSPITSVPVSYAPRLGASALQPWRDGFTILCTFLKNLKWTPDRQAQVPALPSGIPTEEPDGLQLSA